MKPWTTWLARLGIAGACLLVTGCGGSDIPDASDDGQAATESAPNAGAGGGAPAAAAPVEGPKVVQGEPAPGADEAPAAATPKTSAPEPETPTDTPASAEGAGKSSTAEMLAMANGPAAGSSNAPATDSSAPSTNPSAPPGGPGAGMMGGGRGMMMGGRMGGPGMGPMGPGGGPNPGDMQKMRGAMNPTGPGGPVGMQGPGGFGGPGGRGGSGSASGAAGDTRPADFRTPTGAVTAFLAALKAKDLDRLNESTALRAQVEAASSKNRELFKKIFDLSLSESELADLAEKLDGYRISGENPAKSTARVDVVLQKAGAGNDYFRRKVTVRHEKKGWGVLDVAGATEFKVGGMRRNTGGGGGVR